MVVVRGMRPADIESVMAIVDSLREAPHWARDSYEKALAAGGALARIALVAEDAESKIAGFAVAAAVPPEAELETIAVSIGSQRRGIASRLFQELMSKLKERQITEVILEVRESNDAAMALYRSLGFIETGRRSGYYADPQEDALLFRRPVP